MDTPNYSMASSDISHHSFTATILTILQTHFGEYAADVFSSSPVLGYLNKKTKAANRGSKARGAFANHYAFYVIIEDYLKKGYGAGKAGKYSKYEGAKFSDLLKRQRELPFGSKLQNHALNDRLNSEFKKFYPSVGVPPIVREVTSQRYWIQEDLLLVTIRDKIGKKRVFNIGLAVIEIIDTYVATKRAAFEGFLEACKQISELGKSDTSHATAFVKEQLKPNVDARVFEIVSFAVLKARYGRQAIWIGTEKETVAQEFLILYKTGRTNANDGGIDFVMKPLGRFFQVTETIDVTKYFLDIEKVQKFPITFVVKSDETPESIKLAIRAQAVAKYKIDAVVASYMAAVEEIINVAGLATAFDEVVAAGGLQAVMEEIVTQSKVEFNYTESEEIEAEIAETE